MPTTTLVTTIAAGQSLSGAIDCSNADQIFVSMPDGWTGARLTVQFSPDAGLNFFDAYEPDGGEMAFPVVLNGVMRIDAKIASKGWLKLRSGSRRYPVPQAADRQFIVTVVT